MGSSYVCFACKVYKKEARESATLLIPLIEALALPFSLE